MAVRSKKLWSGVSLPNALSVVLYTAQPGETVIVKHIILANPTATSVRIIMSSLGTATPADRLAADLAAGETRQIPVWWVLQPGDIVRALATPGSTGVRTAGFGAELEGVAD